MTEIEAESQEAIVLFSLRAEGPKTRGHGIKVRGERFDGPHGQPFHSEGIPYLK